MFSGRAVITDLRESRLRRSLRLLQECRPGLMLDLACGRGDFGSILAKFGWRIVGVELIGEVAAAAADRIASVVRSDVAAHGLPFRHSCFDAVFAGEIIEHVIDTDGFLAEIHRVLKPGGRLVVTTPNLASLENRLRLLLGIYPLWVDYRTAGSGHVRAYTPRILKRQLGQHGFRIRSHQGNWIPILPQRFADDIRFPTLSRTGNWAPGLAMDIIVAADKS